MENIEKIELLREKTGVSYDEAKKALEENNYDMLDAVLALERQGKAEQPKDGVYTAGASQDMENVKKFEIAQKQYEDDCNKNNFKEGCRRLADFFRMIFKKSLDIDFCINKDAKKVASVPLLVLILLILGFFWVTVPLIVIGLFFGISYNFTGVDKVVLDVNDVCDKASQTAENIKKEFKKDDEKK
ncbi:MAG: UBA/TS-N domain protein [Butyrivibrio sp.]|nr:UBA/TS-N domain protein [Butyrivibrio sp.]